MASSDGCTCGHNEEYGHAPDCWRVVNNLTGNVHIARGELDHINGGQCCQYGLFGDRHACAKQPNDADLPPGYYALNMKGEIDKPANPLVNGAGIDRRKLHASTGRPKGARNLHAKHPSSIARAFKQAGLDWKKDFAEAIKGNKRERIKLWLKLLPYMVTQANKSVKVKKWKGRASKAALAALDALEGK